MDPGPLTASPASKPTTGAGGWHEPAEVRIVGLYVASVVIFPLLVRFLAGFSPVRDTVRLDPVPSGTHRP